MEIIKTILKTNPDAIYPVIAAAIMVIATKIIVIGGIWYFLSQRKKGSADGNAK